MNYWIVQRKGGEYNMIGPYRSSAARDNRLARTTGGEVSAFRSLEADPDKVLREFKEENR